MARRHARRTVRARRCYRVHRRGTRTSKRLGLRLASRTLVRRQPNQRICHTLVVILIHSPMWRAHRRARSRPRPRRRIRPRPRPRMRRSSARNRRWRQRARLVQSNLERRILLRLLRDLWNARDWSRHFTILRNRTALARSTLCRCLALLFFLGNWLAGRLSTTATGGLGSRLWHRGACRPYIGGMRALGSMRHLGSAAAAPRHRVVRRGAVPVHVGRMWWRAVTLLFRPVLAARRLRLRVHPGVIAARARGGCIAWRRRRVLTRRRLEWSTTFAITIPVGTIRRARRCRCRHIR